MMIEEVKKYEESYKKERIIMTLAEKFHQEVVSLMKEKGKELDEKTKVEIIHSIEESSMDGDFEAIIRVPSEKGEFAKAFLIGEGFVIKKEDWLETKTVFKVSY